MGTSFDVERGARASIRLGQGVLVVFAAYLVASAVTIPLADAAVGFGLVVAETAAHEILKTIIQFASFLIAVAGFFVITDDWGLVGYNRPAAREVGLIIAGLGGLLLIQFGLVYLAGLIGIQPAQNQALVPGQQNPDYFLYMIVVSIAIVGPAEELLFRGVVQGLLRRAWGSSGSILVAAGFFGLIHLLALEGTTGQLVLYVSVATLLGCVLGYLYEHTRNIVVPGLAHGGYNATLFAIQYVTAVGLF